MTEAELSGRIEALETAYTHLMQQLLLRPNMTQASVQAVNNTTQFDSLYDSRDALERRTAVLESKYISHSMNIARLGGAISSGFSGSSSSSSVTGVVSGLFVTGQKLDNNIYFSGLNDFRLTITGHTVVFNPGPSIRAFTLLGPQVSDDFTMMYTERIFTVQSIYSLVVGNTPGVVWNLYMDSGRAGTGVALVTTGITSTSTGTGSFVPVIDNTIIPSGYFVWVTVTGVQGTVDELFARITLTS